MKCIIPLAGPDIYTKRFGLKPIYDINGISLLVKAINSRNWYGKSLKEKDLIFVLRIFKQLKELQEFLQSNFPKGKQIVLPSLTKGALLSSLGGIALINDFTEPIVVDLVDVFFNSDINPVEIFNEDKRISGIIPYFHSDNPQYSYLKLNEDSNVLKAKEKIVISKNASAGVYFFRSVDIFLKATIYSLNNYQGVAYNSLLYLCPSFNGIIGNGKFVKAIEILVENEISLKF